MGFYRHFDAIVVMRQPSTTGMPVAGLGLRSTGLYVPIAACGSWFSPPPLVALISCCVRHCRGSLLLQQLQHVRPRRGSKHVDTHVVFASRCFVPTYSWILPPPCRHNLFASGKAEIEQRSQVHGREVPTAISAVAASPRECLCVVARRGCARCQGPCASLARVEQH